MSSAAASRKPNVQEQKIHQAALADPRKSITPKECEALVPDSKARMDAINFLLATGLLKAMKDTKGNVLFRAVMKKEMEVKKDMSGEESMVLSHIQASGNEGIWTKHLKAKTELHQTVIDRCLKSLTQKQLIKAAKSVEFPTRKMYMLYHLDPSVKMTGGPWYTDNELDTEFIKLLCSACLRFIRDRSLPKASSSTPNNAPLYPIAQVLNFLRKSRITETTLEVEHAEMLLGVLVLDGDVERLPTFGAAMWESNMEATTGDGSDDETRSSSSKKRKRKDKEREGSLRKRKRSKRSHSDAESDSEDSDPEDDQQSKSKSKSKRRARTRATRAIGMTEVRKKTRHGKRGGSGANRRVTKKVTMRKTQEEEQIQDDSESESSRTASSDSDTDARPRSKSKSKSKSKRSSPALQYSLDAGDMDALEYGAHVYRAVRQEYAGGVGLGQAPCTRCPTFDFCKPGGPWLGVAPGGVEKEDADQRAGKDDQLTGIDF
ncbi:RNA polymerase Rpc34 subunit-domain-containing protein [Fomitopsis serialis]|uniref:RNA polymerase Rpc34 subunit-domain-containing protein n=1 Tax=Fomitopsis serialis TaxID=139415 RepID=UPI0020086A82|nr:RNA polymerase Rpc34 subunit-domain-containing protein [Neoantrodia serialis]KAH9908233.1 RNA polymerase Rpc34 subunit-domain-containing protein [Neoantrodia serialis]